MRPLVILRPEPGASRTAARAEALGIEAIRIPLFALVPVDWRAPDPADYDAIILTSANAVRHGGTELEHLRSLPVHAVGEATAAAARSAGFMVASVGKGGSKQMRVPSNQRLLHLAGRDHVESGIADAVTVYESRVVDRPEGLDRLTNCVAAVHSPRAGERLAELVGNRSSVMIAAISEAAAEACGSGWSAVAVAEAPNDPALLALAARLCQHPPG